MKEFYGAISITARIKFNIEAETEEEATDRIFNSSVPMKIVDENGNEIEIEELEWDFVDEARRGYVSYPYLNDYEICEEE